MKLSKVDILVTILLTLNIIYFTNLSYQHFNANLVEETDYIPVGSIKYKNNLVKRKYKNRLIWNTLQKNSNIFLHDSILTGDESEAIIELNTGSKININPNSMIEIYSTGKDITLNLQQGVINTNTSKNNDKLFIQTKDGRLDISQSDTIINQQNGHSDVFVKKGNIKFTTNGKETLVSSGEILRLAQDGSFLLEKVQIQHTTPENGNVVLVSKKKPFIKLKWKSQLNSSSYEIKLSKTPNFKNPTIIKTKKDAIKFKTQSGNWYWQVNGFSKNKKQFSSPIYSFSIVQNDPIEVFYPQDSELIVPDQNKPILFRWNQSDTKNAPVNFIIAKDPKFKKIVYSKSIQQPFLQVTNLKKGEYYWKITKDISYKSEKIQNKIKSQQYFFVVNNSVPKLKKPIVNLNSDNFITVGRNKVLNFSWNSNKKANSYQFTLYKDDIKTIFIKKQLIQNYLSIKLPWDTKKIQWELIAIQHIPKLKLRQSSDVTRGTLSFQFKRPLPPSIIKVHIE